MNNNQFPIVVVEESPGEGISPKLEVCTEVPYITKRNWNANWEEGPFANEPGADAYLYRTAEPIYNHVNYGGFVAAVLSRIDEKGFVNGYNFLTEKPEAKGPLDLSDLSKLTFEDRRALVIDLAEFLHLSIRDIFIYSAIEANDPDRRMILVYAIETLTAEEIGKYRDDPELLRAVVDEAEKMQLEGWPTWHFAVRKEFGH